MATDRENADKIILWTAQKTGAQYVVAIFGDYESDVIRGDVNRIQLAERLRMLADRLEGR
jgi:hypothetical protein